VRNRVEVRLQVRVVYLPPARLQILTNLLQRLVGRPAGAEPERAVQEVRLEDRLQDQQDRHLHRPVSHRRNAQWPQLAIGLGDVHALHRLGPIRLGDQRFPDLRQEAVHPLGRLTHLLDADSVHPGRTVVGGHPVPGGPQHVRPIDPVI